MLDDFESRLTDMLADGLSADAGVEVTRVHPGLTVTDALVTVQVIDAAADPRLGDDARERLGVRGAYELRPVFRFSGEIAIELLVSSSPGGGGGGGPAAAEASRPRLVQLLDRILLILHPEGVRRGESFQTGADLGFALEGFRLLRTEASPFDTEAPDRVRAVYQYTGRFWPVEVPAAGDLISELPTRIAVLPIQLPERVVGTAGGGEVDVPVRLDLRALNGAPARLVGRLAGASPPGILIGDSSDLPPGRVGYGADADGVFHLRYAPPGTLADPVRVRVELGLSHADRPTLSLGELTIEVQTG